MKYLSLLFFLVLFLSLTTLVFLYFNLAELFYEYKTGTYLAGVMGHTYAIV